MKNIYIVNFSHKHGIDLSAYTTMDAAIKCAESIRAEWYPKAKTWQDVMEKYDDNIEIVKTLLEE